MLAQRTFRYCQVTEEITRIYVRGLPVKNVYICSIPYVNTLLAMHPASQVLPESNWRNVFAYGRGTENRTLIDRLKAGYSSR